MAKNQFSLKTLLLATSLVAFVIWGAIRVVDRMKQAREVTRSTHATHVVAFLCVSHMNANNQKWPSGWDELYDDLDTSYAGYGQRGEPDWTIADLKDRVVVNWNPDLSLFKSSPDADPVIWILDQREQEAQANRQPIEGMKTANEILRRYLRNVVVGEE